MSVLTGEQFIGNGGTQAELFAFLEVVTREGTSLIRVTPSLPRSGPIRSLSFDIAPGQVTSIRELRKTRRPHKSGILYQVVLTEELDESTRSKLCVYAEILVAERAAISPALSGRPTLSRRHWPVRTGRSRRLFRSSGFHLLEDCDCGGDCSDCSGDCSNDCGGNCSDCACDCGTDCGTDCSCDCPCDCYCDCNHDCTRCDCPCHQDCEQCDCVSCSCDCDGRQ